MLAPLGGEFRVNSYTTSYQNFPAVSSDADGDFVVVWESQDAQDGSFLGVFGQRYASSGEALGEEFRVNTYTTSNQHIAAVSSDADGDFVVVWNSSGQDGDAGGTFGQRYSSGGAALGEEFRVNTYTTDSQPSPSVSSDAEGDFVVVWRSEGQDGSEYGVFAQRYASSGEAVGEEFRVNTYTTGTQTFPSVSSDSQGDFVVAWESRGQDGSFEGIFGQRYQSSGAAVGEEFRVNTYTTSAQRAAWVSSDADGDFVVVWRSDGQDGQFNGVFGQRYASNGEALGGEFRANTFTFNEQRFPSVASDAAGSFLVVWESNGNEGNGFGIFARRYTSDGAAQGAEFRVNTFITSVQIFPAVSGDADGNFVVAWNSDLQDGSEYGVFAQRFGLVTATPTGLPAATPTLTPEAPTGTPSATDTPDVTGTPAATGTATPDATGIASPTATGSPLPQVVGQPSTPAQGLLWVGLLLTAALTATALGRHREADRPSTRSGGRT